MKIPKVVLGNNLCKSKIDYARKTILCDDNVSRMEIAMRYTFGMKKCNCP